MGLFSLFSKKKPAIQLPPFDFSTIGVDMHSHLLHGIDDGAATLDHSIGMILKFKELGYKKLIATPHIMMDCYQNTPEIIAAKHAEVKAELERLNIDIEFEAAAENFYEEALTESIKEKRAVTFNGNYLLFEFSFFSEPAQIDQLIFDMSVNGYIPVLAHYERYPYYFKNPAKIEEYRSKGVQIQVNLLSIVGHYGPDVMEQAHYLIDNQLVDFVSLDCHRIEHLEILERCASHPYFHKLADLNLKNKALL